MTTKPKDYVWENYNVPPDYVHLRDEHTLGQLRYIRDRCLGIVVSRFFENPPVMKGTLSLLETANRVHMQMEMVYKLNGYTLRTEDDRAHEAELDTIGWAEVADKDTPATVDA